MARPRTPSNVLELKGSFKTHPERRREDLKGVGPFDPMPPATLPQELVAAWREIVAQINPIVLTASDRSAVELMTRLWVQAKLTNDIAVVKELRQWFAQFGMTPVGRTKLPAPKPEGGGNTFADV